MKKYLILFLVIIIAILLWMHIPYQGEVKNVLYGERPDIFETSKNTSRWFFDKMGHLYPKESISNIELSNNKASIKEYYKNNPKAFCLIAKNNGLNFSNYSGHNFGRLQNELKISLLEEADFRLADFSNIYVLIHGFRKPLVSQHNTTSSFLDNLIFKSAIEQNQKDNYFIEIYWDGMYDFFEPHRRNQHLEAFQLFENEGRTSAVYAGYGLRQMLAQLEVSKMTILSHSLGARVALACLLNTYDDVIPNDFQKTPTPAQDTISICLIAPAISDRPFEEYYDRNTHLEFPENDNYRLYVMFNEEDIVLQKKISFFGPGAKKYGDTSLGCNYEQAIQKLKTTFENKYPASQLFTIETPVGNTHLVEHYVLSAQFRSFLDLEMNEN